MTRKPKPGRRVLTPPREDGEAFARCAKHDAIYDFRVLGHISWPFARAIAKGFEGYSGTISAANNAAVAYRQFLGFFDWMLRNRAVSPVDELLRAISHDVDGASYDLWDQALQAWAEGVETEEGRTAKGILTPARSVMSYLRRNRVLPCATRAKDPRGRENGSRVKGVRNITLGARTQTPPREEGFAFANVPRHNASYDFRVLGHISWRFAQEMARGFEVYASGKKSSPNTDRAWRMFVFLFDWFVRHQEVPQVGSLLKALARGYDRATLDLWNEALALFRSSLVSTEGDRAVGVIYPVKSVLGNFALQGLVPQHLHLPGPKRHKYRSRAKRSLVEGTAERPSPEAAGKVDELLLKYLPPSGRTPEARLVLGNLLLEQEDIGSFDPGEIMLLVISMNDRRLRELRMAAERQLLEAYGRVQQAEAILGRTRSQFPMIREALYRAPGDRQADVDRRSAPFVSDCPRDEALAHVLCFVEGEWGGYVRPAEMGHRSNPYAALIKRFGGKKTIESYFHADVQALVSAMTILLCATGWNVSTVQGLGVDCLEPGTQRGHTRITGNKARSSEGQTVCELPMKEGDWEVSAVRAVDVVRAMTRRNRSHPQARDVEALFISRPFHGTDTVPHRPSRSTVLATFQKTIGMGYTLDMIRPSVLMSSAGRENSSLRVAKVLADHQRIDTTTSYAGRFANKLGYEAAIRTFQNRFQQVVIHDIEGIAERLGITPEGAKRLHREAMRTGLGLLCLSAKDGVQPGTRKGEVCTKQDRCPDCPVGVFVGTLENTVELLMVERCLKLRAPAWEIERPYEWRTRWLPWLAYAHVVAEKMSAHPGKLLTTLDEARRIVADQPVPDSIEAFLTLYLDT